MGVTYLVLAHDRPEQFGRLLRALAHPGSSAVVHIDARSDIAPFEREAAAADLPVVFTAERHDGRWGGFSLVEAELSMLRAARAEDSDDAVVLLSGVDYPIKPAQALLTELAAGAVHMESWPMPCPEHNKPMKRLEQYYIAPKSRTNLAMRLLNGVLLPALPARDVATGLGGRRPYGGSQWWGMPRACVEDVLRFVEAEPGFVRFFRWSRVPDEMFFQTIVGNLDAWRDRVRPPLTFTDWTPRPGTTPGSPATLTSADVPVLLRTPHFFARKFDLSLDREVFDLLDAQRAGVPSSRGAEPPDATAGVGGSV